MPSFEDTQPQSNGLPPALDMRPRDAARLAQQPYPPIAQPHPDQRYVPYGTALPRLHMTPNPYTPHRKP